MYQVVKDNQAEPLFKHNNANTVYQFLRHNEKIIFGCGDSVVDYVIEIIQKYRKDNAKISKSINVLNANIQQLTDSIYLAYETNNDNQAEQMTVEMDTYIDNYLKHHNKFCNYVLKKLNNYRLGFSIVETK